MSLSPNTCLRQRMAESHHWLARMPTAECALRIGLEDLGSPEDETPAQAIAVALLDEHERRLQEKIIYGEPPLGRGAPPHERLAAFYDAMIDLLDTHLHLALGAETGSLRFRTGAYRFWRTHVRMLAAAAEIPESEAVADVLLAPLAPELYQHMRDEGLSRQQIADAVRRLATLLS